jgi:uncharacterized protein with GYD domain
MLPSLSYKGDWQMAINISLVKYTDQGIKAIKDSPKRAQAFRDMAKKKGVTVRDMYWCSGRYDVVVITEGDDEALAATLLTTNSLGNVRTESLRAMDAATFERVLKNVD